MKHLLRFKTFLLMAIFSLLAGTSAWAQSDFSSTETSNVTLIKGTNASDCTVNGKDGIKVGTSKAGGDMSVTVPAGTTHLHVHAAAWKGVTGLSLNISGATTSPSSIDLTADSGVSNNSPFTLSGSASSYYFVIELSNITADTTLKFTSSTGKRFVVWGVNAETVTSGGTNLTDSDLALTGAPVVLNFDLYNNSADQTVSYTTSSTGAVTVSASEYVNTSVNGTTITVTPLKVTPSAQTITVNQAADGTYKAGSVTFTVNVTNSNPAVNNISDITAAGTYKVRGTIVAKSQRGFIVGDGTGYVYYYNQNYTQADYNIGDMVELNGSVVAYGGVFEFNNTTTVTAATSSNYVAENPTVLSGADMDTRVASTTPTQLSSYVQYEGTLTVSGTYYNITSIDGANTAMGSISFPLNTDFTSLNGKKVKVTGYYVGISSSKYYNTLIGSIDEVVVTTPTLTVEPAVVNLPYTGGNGDFTVSPSNVDNAFGAYITYYDPANTENTVAEPEWLNVGYDYSNLSLSYSVTEENTTGAARTACFKYSVMCDNGPALSNMITVTQAAFVADYATLPFTFDGGKADIETTAGLTQEGLDSDYANSPKLKFNGTDDYVILKFNERPGTLTFDIKGNSFSGGTFTVQTSEDGVTYTDLKTYDDLGSNQSEEFNNLGEDVRYIKWVYTNKSEGNVALGNIALAAPTPSITITPDTYEMDAKAGGGVLPVVCENLASDPQLAVVFVESDGVTPATYDWISATINADGNIDGQITANDTGAARTAYFKVSGKAADGSTVYSNLVTFTQQAAATEPYITVNTGVWDVDANGGSKTFGFDHENLGSNPTFEVKFFEQDGVTETGCGWISYQFDPNDNKVTITAFNNDEGAARTVYFKVYAEVNKTTIYSNLVTVNQAAPAAPVANEINLTKTLVFDIEDNGDLSGTYATNDSKTNLYGKWEGDATATEFEGFTFNQISKQQAFQFKANVGKITFPKIKSAYGFDVTYVATAQDVTVTIDDVETSSTTATEATLVLARTTSGAAKITSITLTPKGAPSPSIALDGGYEYNVPAAGGDNELPVTCSNMPANPQLAVVFVEADGVTSATYNWITAAINANGNIAGHIDANTGAARTAYLVVTGVDADNNVVKSNLVTINQAAPAAPSIVFNPASIDFDANGGSRTIGGDYFKLEDFDSTPSLEILYYESDGDTEKQGGYDWLTADFISNNQIDFTWGTNTGAARSAYLKIHAVGTSVYSNLFTVNQAAYVNPNAEHYYQKVADGGDLTDGQYLIVYEEGTVAFDGGLSTLDAVNNTISVTIVGDKIEGNSTTDAATFTIDVTAGTLQSASGLYIGQTSDANGLANGATAYQNTLSIDADGNADVISSSAHLRYNATSGQDRFRYFKSSTYTAQKAIQLYKRVEGAIPGYVATPTFDPAAGEVQAGTLVTISTTTANATIRYTTDGSEPTTLQGEVYDKPIVINSAVTIKAIAVDDNWNVSAVAEATYTIATSSQLSPELTLDPKSLNVTEGAANGTVTVTTAAGYNGTITVMVDDPSVADASYDAGVITVVYGHAGSAVISVTAGADGDYVEQMEQISVNVSAPVQPAQAGVVVWSEDWSSFDLTTDGETPAANGDFTYTYIDGKNATKLWNADLAGGSAPELLINQSGGQFIATVPLYGAYGNLTLKFQTNNKLTEIHAKVDDDTNNDITVDPETVNDKQQVYTLPFTVAEGAKQVVLTFTNKTSKNVRIDNFELLAPQVAVNISAVGYSTMYYASSNLVVPAGVTVSTYKVNSSNITESRQYTEGDVLPKANGYVLNGAAGNYTFTATNNDGVADKDNVLRGYEAAALTTGPDAGEYLFYLLGVGSGNKVGFFWGADNGAAFTSGSHKAYLAVPKDVANDIRGFYFDGTTTSIDALNLNIEGNDAYDLQGRRVQQVQKGGLYIINGKKMLAK